MSFWIALQRSADAFGDRPFLTGTLASGATREQLLDTAMRLIAAFDHLGLKLGDRVAVMAPSSEELVSLEWGLAGVGALQVPLNPALHGPLLSNILAEIEPSLVVASPEHAANLREAMGATGLSGVPVMLIGAAAEADGSAAIKWADAIEFGPREGMTVPDHCPLVIIFTSGTTGPSKGVVLSHRWVVDYCSRANHALGIDGDDRHYGFLPMHHIAGQFAHVGSAALAGASVALCEPFRAERFWHEIAEYKCTAAILMASMVSVLRSERPPGTECLRKLHIVPLPADYLELGMRLACHISTNYGSTEASIPIASPVPSDYRSCGRLVDGYEARVVDEWDEELPDGTVGELVLRHAKPWSVMSEYWRRSDATAAAWRNGWLHTGDLFIRRPDGSFEFVDRAKDAVRRRGENISTYELEMLAGLHPRVNETAVIAIDMDDGDQEVAMLYVAEGQQDTFAPHDLLAHLQSVAPRHMLPRYIRQLPSLPKTETGKVQKSDLRQTPRELFWDRHSGNIPQPLVR